MAKHKVIQMEVGKVFPMLVAKAERKGRTASEVYEVICWHTGYTKEEVLLAEADGTTYERFFQNAPMLNPARKQIRGVICGVRVEDIQDPLMQEIRYLDKMVDELAKGKTLDKIFRKKAEVELTPFSFEGMIESDPDKKGAFVRVPIDIKAVYGKGRLKAEFTFDGEPYTGSIVNMGVKNEDGSICYIVGILKQIRSRLGKNEGDKVLVSVHPIA